jgi:hypothetical protein
MISDRSLSGLDALHFIAPATLLPLKFHASTLSLAVSASASSSLVWAEGYLVSLFLYISKFLSSLEIFEPLAIESSKT